jgi:hypothetical protein
MVADKIKWFSHHNQDCGKLYGMLPLIRGMPITLLDHIDRSPEKLLLRGKFGHVHSWVLHEKDESQYEGSCRVLDRPPIVVFVKFPGAEWKLDGLNEPGLYPIRPWTRAWYLDKNRRNPGLKISRYQLPIALAFAMTAHAAQGQTLEAAIIDLQLGRGVSSISSYVAVTRVRARTTLSSSGRSAMNHFARGRLKGPHCC